MATPPIAYENRQGVTYFLHASKTKTGKPRYFMAKVVGPGAVGEMPDGYEITESVNGVVSVRRADPQAPKVPAEDVALVRGELLKHRHLRHHRADAVRGGIIVFEPTTGLSVETEALFRQFGMPSRSSLDAIAARTRYAPVLKFVRAEDGYDTYRMTYRGDGGWSWPLASGPLTKLVHRFIPVVGTEAFFDLM